MSTLARQDADLHNEDGTHRTTSPSTSGSALAQYEARIQRHLADHDKENNMSPTIDIAKAWAWVSSSPQDAYVGRRGAVCAECGEGSLFCEDQEHPLDDAIKAEQAQS